MPSIRRKAGVVLVVLVGVAAGGLAREWRRGVSRREATRLVSVLRARPSWSAAVDPVGPRFTGQMPAVSPGEPVSEGTTVHVTLPARSSAPAHLEDVATHVAVDVTLVNAQDVAAQSVDGYNVYPHAHPSGATMLERALPTGAEDFISFETRPAVPEVDYRLRLGEGVSGLRLVADTLEMVDKDGTPRLRAAPPYIVGADGARTEARLAVEDCAVDEDASAPWGRPVTPPNATDVHRPGDLARRGGCLPGSP